MYGRASRHELDEVPLADLGVVEVQVQPQVRAVDRPGQRQGVGGTRERRAGVVDGEVEVLQREHPSGARAELGHAAQGVGRREPHRRRHHLDGPHRQALVVEPGAVQVQPRAVEPLRHRERLLRGGQQVGDPVRRR